MRIEITQKSKNKKSWINDLVGESFRVVSERSKDDPSNMTGGDEYIVITDEFSIASAKGCVEKINAVEV